MNRYTHSLCFLTALIMLLSACGDGDEGDGVKTGRKGSNIVETGELAARKNVAFVMPMFGRYWYQMRIIGILEQGAIVEAGDSIIQLDPATINKSILDWEQSLEQQRGNLEKLQINQDITMNTLHSSLKSERASFNLKKIEFESSQFETERIRRIKELEFEQAKIRIAKEERKIVLTEIINRNDLKIAQIRFDQFKQMIDDAYAILPSLTIRTSVAGVFQIARNWRSNAFVKVGDELYDGANMANVPELKWMKVNTYISENDFLKVSVGQKVAVRMDAMQNVVFEGKVDYIGKLCHLKEYGGKNKQKVFDVEVSINEPDERLKPGMTVSCEFIND
ncbi:MAG: efflux RND transporter periplasmic adaptor subunit [Tannerella sp.]|nr:efflux RND transporter periplasmic adaptor subunit [Tannerella sp.]